MTETGQSRSNLVACSALMVLTAMRSEGHRSYAIERNRLPYPPQSTCEEEQADLLEEIDRELRRIAQETVGGVSHEVCEDLLLHLTNGLSTETSTIQ